MSPCVRGYAGGVGRARGVGLGDLPADSGQPAQLPAHAGPERRAHSQTTREACEISIPVYLGVGGAWEKSLQNQQKRSKPTSEWTSTSTTPRPKPTTPGPAGGHTHTPAATSMPNQGCGAATARPRHESNTGLARSPLR